MLCFNSSCCLAQNQKQQRLHVLWITELDCVMPVVLCVTCKCHGLGFFKMKIRSNKNLIY